MVLSHLSLPLRKKKIVLQLEFSDREQYVDADKDKIQQILYNLIDNAIKFSNTDSSIRVTTEAKGSKVFIAVKDYGIGIPRESLKRIWERFYKTDLSRGRDKKGTGLGLSIVKEIITAHNENITVVESYLYLHLHIVLYPKTLIVIQFSFLYKSLQMWLLLFL